ncbi:cysteine-rich small domain-containing protein [Anaerovorax odorimutans]|uniref:Cysteine-rich small domain-containing protein n=1 Tax=Anaerovorax odorimutans TaxID=109327 RepID=A0ABT1RM49_9FIRM|nr:cysteine-rich small domain-containing protein [Anaerovorax odorimutans]MCQ4636011.1 cysteine-rich small domain-containing protein [Anaerovorax odorimutans]
MFFSHRDCEFFPCHKAADTEQFNCLFCYCPLYALGDECGGNFNYTENGIKDCSDCTIPHSPGGYEYIMKNFSKIVELTKKDTE